MPAINMARYQIIIAYDGTHFFGSQRQADTRTVQGELEKALQKMGWSGKSVQLSGRTDTGTHASGQVAAFDLDWRHGLKALEQALNSRLPQDMAVRQANPAEEGFNPRRDATSRRYQYRLFHSPLRDPLRERYAWRVWPALEELESMAGTFIGRHDFAAYGSPMTASGSTVRTVHSAAWKHDGDEWTFDIQADAFLYRMVRRLVWVQVAAAQGRFPVETLEQALAAGNSAGGRNTGGSQMKLPGGLAPASGLTLVEVRYDGPVR